MTRLLHRAALLLQTPAGEQLALLLAYLVAGL